MKIIGYESYTSWLVTASFSVILCLSTTPYRIAGLLLVLITEHYDTNRETASLPIFLFLLISCLGGPVFGVVGETFGLELVTIVGCVLAAIGFGTCFFASNIVGMSLLLGIVFGVGLAFSTALAPNIIKKHFTRNFTTANGIAHAGSCVGALFIPPLATFLIDLYGVSGAFLILSGIMLNSIPVGIYIHLAGALQHNLIKHQANENTQLNYDVGDYEKKLKINNQANSSNIKYEEDTETYVTEEGQKEAHTAASLNHKLSEGNLKNLATYETKTESATKYAVNLEFQTQNKEDNRSLSTVSEEKENVRKTSIVMPSLPLTSILKDKQKKNLYGFSVFKELSFLMMMLNIGLATYVTTLFWTTMIDYSRDKGISRDLEIYFLMLQPFVDLIGRACFGWVTDLGYLTLSNYAMLCYGQMALSMFFIMWTSRFGIMMAGACWYALASGAITTVYPGMIFKCVDKDHQTMAIASRYLLYGALVLTSSPLIGYFRETLGSYDGLYCLFILLCIVCAAIIPLMFRLTKNARTAIANGS